MKQENIGSSFDDFLADAGILEEVEAVAVKRVLARQVEKAMQDKGLTKTAMARRMKTSRMALDRLLDPENTSVTLHTMQRAAATVGKRLRLSLQ